MDAPVSPQESIAGMREVIAQSGPERSGPPWDVRGIRLPRWKHSDRNRRPAARGGSDRAA